MLTRCKNFSNTNSNVIHMFYAMLHMKTSAVAVLGVKTSLYMDVVSPPLHELQKTLININILSYGAEKFFFSFSFPNFVKKQIRKKKYIASQGQLFYGLRNNIFGKIIWT